MVRVLFEFHYKEKQMHQADVNTIGIVVTAISTLILMIRSL